MSVCFTVVVVVVVAGFFEVVVAAGFLVVLATVADVGLLAVTAEELLSCLLVEGFDVSEEVSDELFCLSELSADGLSCLSELSDDELFCPSELVLSEASDEVSEDEPLSEEAVSCDTVSAEDTVEADDELSTDMVLLSALQPQADIMTAAHKIREMIRFFMFLSFCLRFNVTLQDFVFDYIMIILYKRTKVTPIFCLLQNP